MSSFCKTWMLLFESLNVNVLAPFLLTKLLLSRLEFAHDGVIDIASIHTALPKHEFIANATSKAVLIGPIRSMHVELGSRVRVHAICLAAIDTDMLKSGFVGREKEFARLEAAHPVGLIGTPGELADFSVVLASPKFRFMSGGIYISIVRSATACKTQSTRGRFPLR